MERSVTPLTQLLAEARRDHRALWNKVDQLLPKLRGMDPGQGPHLEVWLSPRKNEWLLHFSSKPNGLFMQPMLCANHANGEPFGLVITTQGIAYHLTSELIKDYGERYDPTGEPIERLQSFFYENFYYVTERRHERHPGVSDVRIGMDQGLALGLWDHATDVIEVRRYVSYKDLFPEHPGLLHRMDLELTWSGLSPIEQAKRIDRTQKAILNAA